MALNIENKLHMTLRDKEEKKIYVGTTKEPLAEAAGIHVNTLWNYYNSAISQGGFFENDRYMLLVSWIYVKANRGRKSINLT